MNELEDITEKIHKLEELIAKKEDKKQPLVITPLYPRNSLNSGRKTNAVVDMIEEMTLDGRSVIFEPEGTDSIKISVVYNDAISSGIVSRLELLSANYPGAVVARTIKKCSDMVADLLKTDIK